MPKSFFALVLLALAAFSGAARGDDQAYILGDGGYDLGNIDLTTGDVTPIGSTGNAYTGLGEGSDGTLFTGALFGNGLYSLDPSTGAATLIGNGSLTYYTMGSTTTGLYALSYTSSLALYSINPANGHSTLIGTTGIYPGNQLDSELGLSAGSGSLYMIDDSSLYKISTTNGAATYVGDLGSGIQLGASVFENGTLYGTEDFTGLYVDTVDPGAGTATEQTSYSSFGLVYGLAPQVPEPACGIILVGIAGTLSSLRLKRKSPL